MRIEDIEKRINKLLDKIELERVMESDGNCSGIRFSVAIEIEENGMWFKRSISREFVPRKEEKI